MEHFVSDFKGLGIYNWQMWSPSFFLNFGPKTIYKEESVNYERSMYPNYEYFFARQKAAERFEVAAMWVIFL